MQHSNRRLSIYLALVHNNNVVRNTIIEPQIEKLSRLLKIRHSVEISKIAYQPALIQHSMARSIKKNITYEIFEYQWKKYRNLPISILKSIVFSIKHALKNYLSKQTDICLNKNSAIETIITDKHIRAWDGFLESGCEVLICFEDDAVFRDDSHEKLEIVLKNIKQLIPATCLYADLAGGFTSEQLKIQNLEQKKDGFLTYYKKPVTNTACVYLINRSIAENFKATIVKNPSLRFFAVDWVINNLLMKLPITDKNDICFHTYPTIFKHGSMTGEFDTWQRSDQKIGF